MMNSLSEKDRRALRFGGFGLAAIVLLMLVVLPAMEYSDRLNRRLEEAQKKLRTAETNVTNSLEVTMKQEKLREKASLYPDIPSLNRQTAAMLLQVQRLPAYRTLVVQRLEGLPMRADEDFYRSAVSLQISGDLSNLHQLLQQMEASRPALRIDRLTVVTDRNNPERIEGQLVISAYAVVTGKGRNG